MSTQSQHENQIELVAQRIDPDNKLLRTWQPEGGVSAEVTVLEIEKGDGDIVKWLLRQHGSNDLQKNPNIAADEYKLLGLLRAIGLAVPLPIHLDLTCEIFPTPFLVVEYIEGKTCFSPSNTPNYLVKLAETLVKIHRIDHSYVDLSFLPSQEQWFTNMLGEASDDHETLAIENQIQKTLEPIWPIPQRNKAVLLHGDYWPGNVLWRDKQIVGVIDWEDAKTGDPLADLANTRLEILWAYGDEFMNTFTEIYRSKTSVDFTCLPYWDLFAGLRSSRSLGGWGLSKDEENSKRAGISRFAAQAFEKISSW